MKYILSVIIVVFVVVSIWIVNSKNEEIDALNNEITLSKDTIQTVTFERDSIKGYFIPLENLINNNDLLWQHAIAVKFASLPPTRSNVKSFCENARLKDASLIFGVALKETAFKYESKNNTARYGNLPGFKLANRRFTWAVGKARQNNAVYEAWPFSIIDLDFYLRNGSKNWSAYSRKEYRKIKSYIEKHSDLMSLISKDLQDELNS